MSNEHIWKGEFGDEYTKRNDKPFKERQKWWDYVTNKYHYFSVLEVGCNKGHNLDMISPYLDHPSCAWGVDLNEDAVMKAKALFPYFNIVLSSGLDLPFKDDYFDMVFTAGVLIHQSPSTVETMMQEIIRVSRKWIMAIEYDAEVFTEIPYRGLSGALFKGPFGEVYEGRYGLRLLEKTPVGADQGFDRCTAWILSKE
jgi:pseudaminic acid biosynthesis-associated methylase